MTKIEEIILNKMMDLINYILSKALKPDITIDKVTELNEKELENIKKQYEIEGIIIDVDDTLRKDMKSIPKVNRNWIESLKEKFKIVILSNGKDRELEEYFSQNNIDYIGFAFKPLKRNFLKACKKMNLKPNKVLVIGDSLIDDIYGAKRLKMKSAIVKNVEDDER